MKAGTHKWFGFVALLIIVSLVLSACAQSPAAAPTAAAPAAPTAAAPAAAPTTGAAPAKPAAGAFDWKANTGVTLKVLTVKHPWTDYMITKLKDYEALTGQKVVIDLLPEEQYFDKVTTTLAAKSGEYDVYWTGFQQVWQYAPPGWFQDLDPFINDASKTAPDYDFADIYPQFVNSLRWDKVNGHPTGTGPLWAIPEHPHATALMYQKDLFAKYSLKVPDTFEELYTTAKKIKELEPKLTPFEVRGTRSWATIHAQVLGGFLSYGGQDFDTNLNCLLDSDKSVAFHTIWSKTLREAGPTDYSKATFGDITVDLSSGQLAMSIDAEVLGFWAEQAKDSPVKGKLGYAPPPAGPDGKRVSGLWVWAYAMNSASKNKDAAWKFIQWTTSKDMDVADMLNGNKILPIRKSTQANKDVLAREGQFYGLPATLEKTLPITVPGYTPQNHFFEFTTEWSGALQSMISDGKPVKDSLTAVVSAMKGLK
jgi:multiple sugar transport system substrate-binding protein